MHVWGVGFSSVLTLQSCLTFSLQPLIQLLRVKPPRPAHLVGGDVSRAGEVIERGLAHLQVLRRFFQGQPVRHGFDSVASMFITNQ